MDSGAVARLHRILQVAVTWSRQQIKYNGLWPHGLLDWSLGLEARQQALPKPPKRSCGAPEHLKELSNTLHGADLKLSKTSECLQQASKHPTGALRNVTEHRISEHNEHR